MGIFNFFRNKTLREENKKIKEMATSFSQYDQAGFRYPNGEFDSNNNKIGIWKTFRTLDGGETEFKYIEEYYVINPNKNSSILSKYTSYYENSKVEMVRYFSLDMENENFIRESEKESGEKNIESVSFHYYDDGEIYKKVIEVGEKKQNDSNEFSINYEILFWINNIKTSEGFTKNGLKFGKWKFYSSVGGKIIEKNFFPLFVNVIENGTLINSDVIDEVVFEIDDQNESLIPIPGSRVTSKSHDGEFYDDFPILNHRGGQCIIDFSKSYTSEKSFENYVENLKKSYSTFKLNIESEYVVSSCELFDLK